MRLSPAPVLVFPGGSARSADLDRTAAVLTLVGCVLTLLSSILPWGEKATFGFSLTTIQGENARILLAVLAGASASGACTGGGRFCKRGCDCDLPAGLQRGRGDPARWPGHSAGWRGHLVRRHGRE